MNHARRVRRNLHAGQRHFLVAPESDVGRLLEGEKRYIQLFRRERGGQSARLVEGQRVAARQRRVQRRVPRQMRPLIAPLDLEHSDLGATAGKADVELG